MLTGLDVPLTPIQRGMAFHQFIDPRRGVDIEQIVVTLQEPVDATHLRDAWRAVVVRHPVLHSTMVESGSGEYPLVADPAFRADLSEIEMADAGSGPLAARSACSGSRSPRQVRGRSVQSGGDGGGRIDSREPWTSTGGRGGLRCGGAAERDAADQGRPDSGRGREGDAAEAFLPRPEMGFEYVAPESDLQGMLVATWEAMLEIRSMGVQDHFFELGGNSLLLMRLVSMTRQGIVLPLEQALEERTTAHCSALATDITRNAPAPVNAIARADRNTPRVSLSGLSR